ncbi:MAG: BamA/TamA family outer membrane protein [Sandaracinaceae bacterium]|nr:BamA/TamA family outer membrane protein [Sandaracinaceae bacterium]
MVHYRRYGGSLGTGVDLGSSLRFTLDYQLEAVEVTDRPTAASHSRGADVVPIDFAIHDGLSWLSSLQLGLVDDERDDPALPTQGRYVFVRADVSSTLLGSSYDFVRVQGAGASGSACPRRGTRCGSASSSARRSATCRSSTSSTSAISATSSRRACSS